MTETNGRLNSIETQKSPTFKLSTVHECSGMYLYTHVHSSFSLFTTVFNAISLFPIRISKSIDMKAILLDFVLLNLYMPFILIFSNIVNIQRICTISVINAK